MARFIGYLDGARGPVSRLGTPASGITARAQGWHIGARAEMHADGKDRDLASVEITCGSAGGSGTLYLGQWERGPAGEIIPADATAAKILRGLAGL